MVELREPKRLRCSMEREKEVVAGHDDIDGEREGGARPQKAQLGAKLWRGLFVAKRGGPCTPVCAWKVEENVEEEAGPSWVDESSGTCGGANQDGARVKRHHRHRTSLAFLVAAQRGAGAAVSARELGAGLWEIQEPPRYRMGRRSRHREEKLAGDVSDLSPPGHQAQVAASNLAISPASSLEYKRNSGDSCKTSAELLKVLNRIWALEEQHTSMVSLVRRLKLELENAHVHIRELLHEKQLNHHEIDGLTKQIAENKLARKSKEQERMRATVKSQRAELEDERRLRRHSESLHRRLAKELSEMKSAFSKMLRDLEEEKKAHNLLEDLCDEFAKGIKEYEEEIRELKPKFEKGSIHISNNLMLKFSEAWLDERLQVRLAESRGDFSEKSRMMDRLECELRAFLQARQSYSLDGDVLVPKDAVKDRCLRRRSLESIHLNGAGSAPRYAEDEDSVASDLHCFELNMGTSITGRHSLGHGVQHVEKLEEARNSIATKKKVGSSERFKYQGSTSSQVKIDGHSQPHNDGVVQLMKKFQGIPRNSINEGRKDSNLNIETFSFPKSEEGEARADAPGAEVKLDTTHLRENVVNYPAIETEYGEFGKHLSGGDHVDDSSYDLCRRPSAVGRDDASGNVHALPSPAQRRGYHHMPPDPRTSECSQLPQGKKESTLKAKLLEARLEGQHARLRTSRDTSLHA